MTMTVADFKNVIQNYMNEKDMFYVIVGDKATQLKEVSKLKGKVIEMDINGKIINPASN